MEIVIALSASPLLLVFDKNSESSAVVAENTSAEAAVVLSAEDPKLKVAFLAVLDFFVFLPLDWRPSVV